MSELFEVRTSAKVILAGEHSVVRGGRALVMPFTGYSFSLTFDFRNLTDLQIQFPDDLAREGSLFFHGVLERALGLANRSRHELKGTMSIRSDIPVGAGLGSSAALCVAIGRLMVRMGWVEESKLFHYCRDLEHLFHGESSGVDIAAVLEAKPVQFQKDNGVTPLELNWAPALFVSSTGNRGATAECVSRVNRLREMHPLIGKDLDNRMQECVRRFEIALSSHEPRGRVLTLIEAMNLGYTCFEAWGLNGNGVQEHLEELLSHGALAVKPTGSGSGGYVLSLWQTTPPEGLRSRLISLNLNSFVRTFVQS